MALISQLGITMISPIILCIFVAYQIDKIAHNHYGMLVGIILGIITGCSMVYKLLKATLDREIEEEKKEKQELRQNVDKIKISKPKIASRIFEEKHNE